jgi:cell division protein FtsB
MRSLLIPGVLLAVLVALHVQLWVGRGSLPNIAGLTAELQAQQEANRQAQARNERLTNEVRDLRDGLDMVEERARSELGLVKPNEIFVQITR